MSVISIEQYLVEYRTLLLALLGLFPVDLVNNGLDVLGRHCLQEIKTGKMMTQYLDTAFIVHVDNLHVRRTRLDNFEHCLDGELDGCIFGQRLAPVLLQEILHRFAAPPDCICLPLGMYARRLGQVQSRSARTVDADDEGAEAEWSDTALLCILLLDAGNVTGNILDRGSIFNSQPV